jgi:hypothetical protein
MRLDGLSLDNIPQARTPLQFFLVAPVFGVLAGLLLIRYPELLGNRWLPATLAFTHLLTLGFGSMVMLGALFQVLPVVSNQAVPGERPIAPWIRLGMVLGTLALAAGFLATRGWLLGPAAALLIGTLGLFVTVFGAGLARARPAGDTTVALVLATLSLVATVALGVIQLSPRFWPELGLYQSQFTPQHMIAGGLGWVLLLVMGVSIQVIPMFHVAPAFPRWVSRYLPLFIFLLIAAVLVGGPTITLYAVPLVLLAAIAYAIVALRVLASRKRKPVDYTVRFWQLGLSQLIVAALIGLGLVFVNGQAWGVPAEVLLGLVFGLGFASSVIMGMLQKIVPFLIYLHLQRLAMADMRTVMVQRPHMKALISTERSRRQFRLQLVLLPVIYLAPWVSWLAVAAGILLVATFGWLAFCLWGAWGQCRAVEAEIARAV